MKNRGNRICIFLIPGGSLIFSGSCRKISAISNNSGTVQTQAQPIQQVSAACREVYPFSTHDQHAAAGILIVDCFVTL
jgi:hypothetical protein